MFSFGSIAASIINFIGELFSTLAEYPLRATAAIAGILVVGLAFYAGRATVQWTGGDTPSRIPLTKIKTPQSLSDFLSATMPDRVGVSESPPKSKTDTVRVVVPKYVTKTDTVFLPEIDVNPAKITSPDPTQGVQLDTRLKGIKRGFLLLPLKNNRPTVNVDEDRTVVQTFDPRDASSLRFTYQHPEPFLEFGPMARVSAVGLDPVRTVGTLGGYVRHRNLRIDGGFRFSTVGKITGPTLTLEYTPTLADF